MGRSREINDTNYWPKNPHSSEGRLWDLKNKNLKVFTLESDFRLKNLNGRVIFLLPQDWGLAEIDGKVLSFRAKKEEKVANLEMKVHQADNLPTSVTILQKMGNLSIDSQFSVYDNEWLLIQFIGSSFAIKTGTKKEIVQAGIDERVLQSAHAETVNFN